MIISALAKQCQGIIDLRGDKIPAGDGLLVRAAYAPGDVTEILHHLAIVGADELVRVMPLISPSHVELQESPLKVKRQWSPLALAILYHRMEWGRKGRKKKQGRMREAIARLKRSGA